MRAACVLWAWHVQHSLSIRCQLRNMNENDNVSASASIHIHIRTLNSCRSQVNGIIIMVQDTKTYANFKKPIIMGFTLCVKII